MKIWITLAFLAFAGTSMAAPAKSKTKAHALRAVKQTKKAKVFGDHCGSYYDGVTTYTSCCSGQGCTQGVADNMAYWKQFQL